VFAYHRGVNRSSREPAERVFLDANVIFSAALGGESFGLLWGALKGGVITACTSPQCIDEARRNVTKKRPAALDRLEAAFLDVELLPAPQQLVSWAEAKLPEDDAWVLAGAVEAGAHVLLTGNTRHFGWMMERSDLPLRVRTVRVYLDELIASGRLTTP
jgi:predicted nucleic acid-binding protein